MISIFLSASIPLPERNPAYIKTADVVAIRDAVKSLITETLPKGQIVFGGHPAITPLVALLLRQMDSALKKRVVLYQSRFFETGFIKENDEFVDLRLTQIVNNDIQESLKEMRHRMIVDTQFDAGVFIAIDVKIVVA